MFEGKVKILIVEDNKGFREHVCQMLRDRFSTVVISEASTCLEALNSMNQHLHNLIFMDINLPDGTGLELTKTITTHFSQSVVAMLSVNDIPEYREASYSSGASHFFSKGNFSFLEIVDFIDNFLSGKISRNKLH
jgi:DNA-binding NarL/FixJ family response regulator